MVFPTTYSTISGSGGANRGAAVSSETGSTHSGSSSPTDPSPQTTRVIVINKQPQRAKFCSNVVSTTKYNALTFLPLFLFESFRRYSNAFFLFIAALQQIPDVSPTGRYTTLVPLSFILFVSAIKEIFEDMKRRRADGDVNNRKVMALKSNFRFELARWRDICVGDLVQVRNGEEFPSDLILLASSEPKGICYIETSNLDGETNLKTRLALSETAMLRSVDDLLSLDGTIECEAPNRHLYEFAGKIRPSGRQDFPLGPDQLLLRGSRLKNTEWVYGVVTFTGHDSKLMKNSKQGAILKLKRSQLDEFANRQIILMFGLLIVVCLISGIGNAVWRGWHQAHDWYLYPLLDNQHFGFSFLTFIILYNNLIPISLQVTLEMVRFFQTLFIGWDLDMYDASSETPAIARTSNLNEDLGQVKFIFSDKTGTLTENKMIFRQCSVGGIVYGHNSTSEEFLDTNLSNNLRINHPTAAVIHEFLLSISLCHTVVTESSPDQPNKPVYLAASPDEAALVKAAASLDYVFLSRDPSKISVRVRGRGDSRGGERYEVLEYDLLDVLEFTSERKRMSVIVRTPDGRIQMISKGADSVICDRLAPHQPYLESTVSQLDEFAAMGYRTLCVATANINPEFYSEWKRKFNEAATSLDRRKEKISEACNLIERNLNLIGATAIEDRLQDGVPHCIAQLAKANIKIWVLTGDKMETAVNIGHACNLLTKKMPLLTLNETSLDRVREVIFRFRNDLGDGSQENPVGLVVDGRALHYALSVDLRKEFFDLATACKAVICCRASPMQKADVVTLVRQHNPTDITLAIGDGANDVAMIQTAHIGVGISGKEGLQAVCASDYAISQFKYLQKLLFVHGAWSYERIAHLILYCYHKNICLYIMQFYFAIASSFSGQTLFERWTIGLYNIFFTAVPPFIIGIFDRSCSSESRMRYPALYGRSQRGELFNYTVFWRWILTSLLHAAVIFTFTFFMFRYEVLWNDGQNSGGFLFGAATYTYVIVVVCLKAGIETQSWTTFTHIGIWGSILSWLIFLPIYSNIWPHFLQFGEDFVGIAEAMLSSGVFWFGLLLVPIMTLLVDVLWKAFQNTCEISVVDTVRRFESLGFTDLDLFLQEPKQAPRLERDTLLGTISQTVNPMQNQRGYAFSQEEGGTVSQTQVVNLYGSMDTLHADRERLARLSNVTLPKANPRALQH